MKGGLLVDACCGPCALVAERVLRPARGNVRFIFYNPNVHPFTEYRKRLEAFLAYMEAEGFDHEVLPYRPEEWMRAVAFREEDRCEMCYRLRLRRAVGYALDAGYKTLTTTLFASPYQDHALLASLGESLTAGTGVDFLAWDGREAYREGLQESRSRGMFTQAWCGCLLSERERYDRKARRPAPRNDTRG